MSGMKVISSEYRDYGFSKSRLGRNLFLGTDFEGWFQSLKTKISNRRAKLFDYFYLIGQSGDTEKLCNLVDGFPGPIMLLASQVQRYSHWLSIGYVTCKIQKQF